MASLFGFTFDAASAGDLLFRGIGALGAAGSASAKRRVQQAQADAENAIRDANNKIRASESALSATIRSINNKNILRQSGEQANALAATAARSAEAFSAGRFERGLREQEALGAVVAQSAARGTLGASADAVGAVTALRAARLEQLAQEQQDTAQYDLLVQRTGLVERGIQSVDTRPVAFSQDLARNFGPASTGGSGTLNSLLGVLLDKDSRSSINTFLGSFGREAPAPLSPATLDTTVYAPQNFGADLSDYRAGNPFFAPSVENVRI